LRDIFDPPPLLFARGRVELLATLMLGVVGTRRPTAYGGVAASKLSADLAAAGMTIASGMGRGIDTAAHRGVFEVGAIPWRSSLRIEDLSGGEPQLARDRDPRTLIRIPWARLLIRRTSPSATGSSAA
jgi:hypothetical protein